MVFGVKLSVLIPVYNEEGTLVELVDKVESVDLSHLGVSKELILVDDGSNDCSVELIKTLMERYDNITFLRHIENCGKGAAIKTAISKASGDIMIVQDADLEYDPNDYAACIKPILDGEALVVYGSRRLKKSNKQYSSFAFMLGGIGITWAFNILYLRRISDEPTCYKCFESELIKNMKIDGDGFEWEPEVTAKIAKQGIKIHEVPISYFPRKVSEGKKISWWDGVRAIWTLIKYRFKR